MKQVNVAGLNITAENKTDLIILLRERAKEKKKTKIFTPYSEFLYAALGDPEILNLLNSAEVSLPDGIGIFWAENFLRLGLPKNKYLAWVIIPFQALFVCFALLFFKSFVYKRIPTKIPGSTFIYDLAKISQELKLKVYLAGGFDDTPQIVKQKLTSLYPDLEIVGTTNKSPAETEEIIREINTLGAEVLMVSFGPLRQEQWIAQHMNDMPSVLLAIGLGGTLDYLAGKKIDAPEFFRKHGIEWLFRFFTQPSRFERIMFGTFGLMSRLVSYKYRNLKNYNIIIQ